MNLLDYIIIVTLVFLTIKGILRGFIREVSSLAGVILGIWLANLFQPKLTAILSGYIPGFRFIHLISFTVIFAVVLILCNIIGWAIRLLFKKVFLGWFDKLMGALFAILKTIIITYLVIVLLTFFIPTRSPLITQSVLAPWIIKSYQSVTNLVSPQHYEKWRKRMLSKTTKINEIISEKMAKYEGSKK